MKAPALDYDYYQREIGPCLPPVVLDFHTHTWDADNWKERPWDTDKDGGRYMVTDAYYPPERLSADGRSVFPDRGYEAVCSGNPTPAADWEKDTACELAGIDEIGRHGIFYDNGKRLLP